MSFESTICYDIWGISIKTKQKILQVQSQTFGKNKHPVSQGILLRSDAISQWGEGSEITF